MTKRIGRNVNSNDEATVTTYTINSLTPTVIATPTVDRMYFSVCLEAGTVDVDVYIRLYPAALDNIKQGEVLTRYTAGNANLFRPSYSLPEDNIYEGEISAISLTGSAIISVTEY